MVKASPYIPSSNAGEFSPRMDARVDFEKYGAALSRGLNLICLPQGGVTYRPGTRFIKEVKTSASVTALMPFEPVADQAYMVETGDLYFRFLRNQGQITALFTTTVLGAWTDRSTGGTATGVGAGSGAVLTGAGNGFAWAENAIAIAAPFINQIHVIQFQLSGSPGSLATVQVGTATLLSDLAVSRNMGMGWHTIGFSPKGGSSAFLQFLNENTDTITVANIRVLSNEPLEVVSPYPAGVVTSFRWAQSGDVKYLFYDTFPPYKLERRGDTSWSLVKVFFSDGPYFGINPDTDLAKNNLIKNSVFSGGIANWTQAATGNGFVNYNTVNANSVFFQTSTDAASTALISQSVVTGAINKVHVLHYQIVGGGTVTTTVGTAVSDGSYGAPGAQAAGWYSLQFTPTASPFVVTFAGSAGKAAIVPGVTGAYCYNISARLLQPSALTGSITVTALGDFKPFVSTDVGRQIRFQYPGREPGWGVITAFSTSQGVTVLLYRDLPSTAPLESWRLGAWSDTTGWPHTGTFYQQRLFTGRTLAQPQTIWASQSGDFQNNRPDSWVAGAPAIQDTNALNFTLASGIAAPIDWFIGVRRLIVGTAIGQWTLSSRGAALTPSDFSADPQSGIKARDIAPIQIDSGGLFVQRAKRALYDISYSQQIDGLKASDVTILSDHIAKGSFAQIIYQAEPVSSVWSRLEDGTLTCLTYKRDQNVVGWTPCTLAPTVASAAVVESIAVIPGNNDSGQVYSSINRDEFWMVVRRTIGGVTKRYIEMMEGFFDGPNRSTYTDKSLWRAAVTAAQVDAFYVDCGLTYSGVPTSTITGLAHLNGETVKVVADGAVLTDAVVAAGQITLDLPARKVHVGLSYPWIYRGMKLPYGSPTGAGVGQVKEINGAVLVLRDSASFDYCVDLVGEGDEEQGPLVFAPVPFRRPADPMSAAYPLFSGEVRIDPPLGNGFSSDPRFVLQGTAPMPWTLLGIAPAISESEL